MSNINFVRENPIFTLWKNFKNVEKFPFYNNNLFFCMLWKYNQKDFQQKLIKHDVDSTDFESYKVLKKKFASAL